MDNMRNIIRLKNVPSNAIEEAIIIFKENKKVKKPELSSFSNKDIVQREDKNYIVKEAELIISDYLNNPKEKEITLRKKLKTQKFISISLGILLFVSIIF